MLVVIFTKLQFAYAQFPCLSICGYHLYDIFWEAVERLQRCGFEVVACICDGLSANWTFFKLHGTDKAQYKVLNPYSEEKHSIYFFSDPPHLLKTTRNCWASNKRLMWVSYEPTVKAPIYSTVMTRFDVYSASSVFQSDSSINFNPACPEVFRRIHAWFG